MRDDLINLLLYAAIALAGILANAYKNYKKKQSASIPASRPVSKNFPTGDRPEFGPELGPLMEIFDIPRPEPEPVTMETVESGPSVEEAGLNVDTREASAELSGMTVEAEGFSTEADKKSSVETFEEGQSEIQKMIARYEAIQKELEQQDVFDDISSGEITSVENENERRLRREGERFFDARQAIIYSEILKRKEY